MRSFCLGLLFCLIGFSSVSAQVGVLGTPDGAGVNNLPATSIELLVVNAITVDGQGNFYISAKNHHQIYRVNEQGILNIIAGSGLEGFAGDGGPALQARIWNPHGLAFDSLGNLYIADQRNHRIRKVDLAGRISTFALIGTSPKRYNPVTETIINLPFGLATDKNDNLYVADTINYRVLKVSPTGDTQVVAGTGERGYGGDGGPATQAKFAGPIDVALGPEGNLYIADFNNNRVRKVDTAGVMTTVAGNGEFGYAGDGGPATEAAMRSPSGVVVDGAGNLYIADSNNHCVRKVDSRGKITTVAGTGTYGYTGDGGPATEAQLNRPYDLAIDRDGSLLIVDQDNSRIRKVDPSGQISTVAGKDRYETPHTL